MSERRTSRKTREARGAYRVNALGEKELRTLTRRIVRVAHPELIILFGSRVYGKPRPDSDLDVLVVMDKEGSHAERIVPFREFAKQFPVSLDIQARTPGEVTSRLEMGDEFMQRIVGQGQKVYSARAKNGVVRHVYTSLEKGRTQPMNNAPLVQEWVEKAEGDFNGAQMWARRKKHFYPDKMCWDCQQCVEKYLKAFLTRHRVEFQRIHDLDELLKLCLNVDTDFRLIKSELDKADVCQPKIRYPGASVTEEQAREELKATKVIRKFVRAKLGIP